MIEILGKKYLTGKEASARYGYSYSWFRKRASGKKKPTYIRLEGKGKIYYPVEETDNWFSNNLLNY